MVFSKQKMYPTRPLQRSSTNHRNQGPCPTLFPSHSLVPTSHGATTPLNLFLSTCLDLNCRISPTHFIATYFHRHTLFTRDFGSSRSTYLLYICLRCTGYSMLSTFPRMIQTCSTRRYQQAGRSLRIVSLVGHISASGSRRTDSLWVVGGWMRDWHFCVGQKMLRGPRDMCIRSVAGTIVLVPGVALSVLHRAGTRNTRI